MTFSLNDIVFDRYITERKQILLLVPKFGILYLMAAKMLKSFQGSLFSSKTQSILRSSHGSGIVGKGGHTSSFLRFPHFLEIQDVPTFPGSIGKTKVLNNSCNQFVYNNFLPKSILILE